jgi:hypothetical protein
MEILAKSLGLVEAERFIMLIQKEGLAVSRDSNRAVVK